MKYPNKVSEHIVSWIDNYINESGVKGIVVGCLLYTSPSPRDAHEARMPSSA